MLVEELKARGHEPKEFTEGNKEFVKVVVVGDRI